MRKISRVGPFAVIALGTVLLFALQMTGEHRASAGGQMQGDVTCEGIVDSIDALEILGVTSGQPGDAGCLTAGDVDCSGAADSLDSLRILRFLAALSNPPLAGCVEVGQPLAVTPNSYELINTALAQGEITDEQGLLYKLYASFGDDRLPSQYNGEDADLHDGLIVNDVLQRFSTLSPEMKTAMAPFLLWPGAPGSWLALRTTAGGSAGVLGLPSVQVASIDTSTNVRVWYREDRPDDMISAEAIAAEVDRLIWPQLTGLMGPPVSDLGMAEMLGEDGRIDIALSGEDIRSYAYFLQGCQATSGAIVLGTDADSATVTHELMHVIQFKYAVSADCQTPEYHWMHEAISQWSMDYVYPGPPHPERGTTGLLPEKCFLQSPGLPLELKNDCHEYAAYLFFQYLSETRGPSAIPAVWQAAAGEDSLGAINAALGTGGLRDAWPDFALAAYNIDPSKRFQQWDAFFDGAGFAADEHVTLEGQPAKTYTVRGDVEHMAALFSRYTFEDDGIRRLVFTNPFSDGSQPTAHVTAVIKLVGQAWKVEDWTAESRKSFCYDDGDPEVEQLVIIISNSEYQDRNHVLEVPEQPRLKAANACAGEGTVTVTRSQHGSYENSRGNTVTVDMADTATIEFDLEADVFDEYTYNAPESSISWNFSLTSTEHFPPTEDSPACDAVSSANGSGGWTGAGGPSLLIGWETPDGTLFGMVPNPDSHVMKVLSPDHALPEGDPSAWYHVLSNDFCAFTLEFDMPYAVVGFESAPNPEDLKTFSGSVTRDVPAPFNPEQPPITVTTTWSIHLR